MNGQAQDRGGLERKINLYFGEGQFERSFELLFRNVRQTNGLIQNRFQGAVEVEDKDICLEDISKLVVACHQKEHE